MSILDAPALLKSQADTLYPPINTLGSESAAILMNRLSMGVENAVVTIVGDSTGVIGTAPWPLQVAQWLAAQFPAYTVNYRVWSDTNQAYLALGATSIYPTNNEAQVASHIVATGTGTGNAGGPFVLDIYNASRSGSNATYPVATITRWNTQFAATPNLVFINHGHNSVGASTGYRATQYALTRSIQEQFPQAGIVQIAQNPRATNDSEYINSVIRQRCVIDLSASEGYGLVNIWRRFNSMSNYAADYVLNDGLYVHPNAAGLTIMAQEVIKHLSNSYAITPRAPARSATRHWIPATSFQSYLGSPTLAIQNDEAPMWTFANGVDSGIMAAIEYPSHWGSYDAYLQWTYPQTSPPGNVVWQMSYQNLGLGLTAVNMANSGIAPGSNVNMIASPGVVASGIAYQAWCTSSTRLVANISITTRPFKQAIRRVGTHASDTNPNPVYVLGLLLVRAS